MIVFTDPADVPKGFGPSVVVIGKFDGVHAGHRAAIDRARVHAAASGAKVVAVTFDRHPLSVLRPQLCPQSLVSLEQKQALLAATGVDATLVLRFDRSLADLEPEEFVRHTLVEALGARTVLVGEDFRFGRGGAGDTALLHRLGRDLGFDVEIIGDVRAHDGGRRVSSTWIRELLAAGDVETAARLLGRDPAVRGEVVHGLKRGRELGYPTANLSADVEGLIPADGVYAGWLVDDGVGGAETASPRSTTRYPAAISVGVNPTFDDVEARQVEAYVLDETELDLYGHRVEVQFSQRIRGMAAFQGIEPLKAQIADDVRRVRAALR